MCVIDQLPLLPNVLWKDLKMRGRVNIIFCIYTVIQSLLFSIIDII